jgi:hypothetical protein
LDCGGSLPLYAFNTFCKSLREQFSSDAAPSSFEGAGFSGANFPRASNQPLTPEFVGAPRAVFARGSWVFL